MLNKAIVRHNRLEKDEDIVRRRRLTVCCFSMWSSKLTVPGRAAVTWSCHVSVIRWRCSTSWKLWRLFIIMVLKPVYWQGRQQYVVKKPVTRHAKKYFSIQRLHSPMEICASRQYENSYSHCSKVLYTQSSFSDSVAGMTMRETALPWLEPRIDSERLPHLTLRQYREHFGLQMNSYRSHKFQSCHYCMRAAKKNPRCIMIMNWGLIRAGLPPTGTQKNTPELLPVTAC